MPRVPIYDTPPLQEWELETHADAVNFVKSIFQQMGGTVLPPKRPGHIPNYTHLTVERDAFMMDFENACLSQNWDSSIRAHPKDQIDMKILSGPK